MRRIMVRTDIGDIPGWFTGHMERAAGPADAERLITKVEVTVGSVDNAHVYRWVLPERCFELKMQAIGRRRGFGTRTDEMIASAGAQFNFNAPEED